MKKHFFNRKYRLTAQDIEPLAFLGENQGLVSKAYLERRYGGETIRNLIAQGWITAEVSLEQDWIACRVSDEAVRAVNGGQSRR